MDFSKVRNIIFFGILGLTTILFLYIIRPFFYPIFWAAVIASLSYPIYDRIRRKLRSANIGSILTLLIVLVIIIIPLSLIGSLIIKESIDLFNSVEANRGAIIQSIQKILNFAKHNPLTSRLNIDETQIVDRISELTRDVTSYLFNSVKNITQNSLQFVVMFVIMLYTLFFFIRDGEKFLRKIMYLSPLGDEHEMLLYNKFTSTSRATIKGTIVIGLIQGTLGAILFQVVGIPGAIIWGIIMTLFSVVPGLGSSIVWFPAAIIMLALGNTWQGITMLLFGALVISTIDNFLRPVLVGKDTQMHPLLILFSTLGGIAIFGISGFVIGPIISALLITLWDMYAHYYKINLGNDHE